MSFTVIIVDDDEVCLFIHKRIIKLAKFHDSPQTFDHAKEAVDFIISLPDTTIPVLLFLDINMPVMNGWDVLNIIHQDGFDKEVYVVMVTSSVDARDKEKASSFPKVIDFVEKPFNMSVLLRLRSAFTWLQDERRL